MNALTLETTSHAEASELTSEQAAALQRAYDDGKIRLLRIFLPMGVLLLLAFAPWDYMMSPETVAKTLSIRLVLSLSLVTLWFYRSSSFVRQRHDWIVAGLLVLAGIGTAVVLTIVPAGYAAASGGIALAIMFGAAAVRIPPLYNAVSSILIIGGTALLMTLFGESPRLTWSVCLMLASFGALGFHYNVASGRDAVSILASQIRLRAEKEQSDALLQQIKTMRQDRLTWLESLAHFLRHELSNQIVAVSTSIDLAKSDGSPFGTQTYLERAQRSLGRMRGLVSSATEATSLEAALTVDEVEPVNWSDVVVERVSAFQQLHPLRNLVLELRPGLAIEGNEERLAQMLDKLLENALEHSEEGSEIRVRLGREGDGWAELSVENEGDALPSDRERIFEAFVSSQKRSGNLGIGLFVAQSVARNHGGEIVAEDLGDAPGARFVVRLPMGRAGAEAEPGPKSTDAGSQPDVRKEGRTSRD